MIFVTVGTSKFEFKRLIDKVVNLRNDQAPREKIVVQSGAYDYLSLSKNIESYSFIEFEKMKKLIREARLVISHCGSGTIFLVNSLGKVPYVLARKISLGEHVNNHQEQLLKIVVENKRAIDLSSIIRKSVKLVSVKYSKKNRRSRLTEYLIKKY